MARRNEMKRLAAFAALAVVLALPACSDNDADDAAATDTVAGTADTSSAMAPANGSAATDTATGTTAADGNAAVTTTDDGIISQGSRDPETAGETVKDAAEDAAEAVGDAVTGKR
jgi:hypothetical protein